MTQITKIDICREMETSYVTYAMSVIVSRALPDVRDGLKPVHRRILYSMKDVAPAGQPRKKSARIVGDVMANYHPHGDSAIYDAMVRMGQPWSMSSLLIDKQGNFGNRDGDSPAAMRYTEARLMRIADTMMSEIERDTVDFQTTYDEENKEPTVLPAMFPHAVVNPQTGIAVGMAADLMPHNLGEVIDATLLLMHNPTASVEAVRAVMPGPDFPTGGVVIGEEGMNRAFTEGRGRVTVDSVHEIERGARGRQIIAFTEIPWQVKKTNLIERIREIAKEKRLDGIHDVRDESGKDGVRFVVEVKADADPEVVLAHLRKLTPLRTTFSYNNNVIYHGQPVVMGLLDMIRAWIDFRRQTVRRRTMFDLNKARDRMTVLSGLLAALDNIDWVVETIRHAPDRDTAKVRLMERELTLSTEAAKLVARAASDTPNADLGQFEAMHFTDVQATAILNMRLGSLTGLEADKLKAEADDLLAKIAAYLEILNNPARRDAVIMEELAEIKAKHATPRRSVIEAGEVVDATVLDMVPREDVVITITRDRWAKRTLAANFRAQNRGGRGKAGMDLKDDDVVTRVIHTDTHADLVLFCSDGMAYKVPVRSISDTERGKPLVNYVEQIAGGVEITAMVALPADVNEADHDGRNLMFVFTDGDVRRSALSDFSGLRAGGKRAVPEEASLLAVVEAREGQDILLASSSGKTARTPVTEFRVVGSRTSTGVRGMKLKTGEAVVAATVLDQDAYTAEQRSGYLKVARKLDALENGEADAEEADADEEAITAADLDEATLNEMREAEQVLLMISAQSFGKRSSTYGYRATGRGVQGYTGMKITTNKTGPLVGLAPIKPGEGVMLITSAGQTIRLRADDIRKQARATRGTPTFNLRGGETVVGMLVLPPECNDLPCGGQAVEEDGEEENEGGEA